MKKLLLFAAAFALSALMGVQAADFGFSVSDAMTSAGLSTDRSYRNFAGFTYQGVKFALSSGTNSEGASFNRAGADIRMLAGNKLTVTDEEGLESIVFHISDAGLRQWADVTASEGTVTADVAARTLTWTGTANSVTFTVGATAVNGTSGEEAPGQLYWDAVSLTAGVPANISALPEFSVAPGTYDIVQNLEITAGPDAQIYYTTNGELPTTESHLYTEPIKLNFNMTVVAIAIEPGKEASSAVVAKYIVLYAKTAADIKAFLTDNPDTQVSRPDTSYTFTGNCTVTYQNGRYLFIEDETGGLMVFGALDRTYAPGDVITGFKGTFNGYYGTAQLIPLATSFGEPVSHNEYKYPTGTKADITVANVSRIYRFRDMYFYKDPQNESENEGYADFADLSQFKIVNTFSNDACTDKMTLPANGRYDITAVVSYYSEEDYKELQLAPIAFAEPTGVAAIGADSESVYGGMGCVMAPQGARVFTLAGVECGTTGLAAGVYIVLTSEGAHRVMVR